MYKKVERKRGDSLTAFRRENREHLGLSRQDKTRRSGVGLGTEEVQYSKEVKEENKNAYSPS